jgi:hypothetical protein
VTEAISAYLAAARLPPASPALIDLVETLGRELAARYATVSGCALLHHATTDRAFAAAWAADAGTPRCAGRWRGPCSPLS